MNNLTQVFKKRKAFISFVVAGDPNFNVTVAHVVALANAGSDIVELGIPFSDPVADGPEIQAADLRAFKDHTTTERVFEMVTAIREQTQVPLVFLTYINIVFKYGYEAFTKRCAELGVSGLVIPDLPLEEQDELRPFADRFGINLIPLIAPTSPVERIQKIAKKATGFIYVVSSMGVTGVRNDIQTDLKALIENIHQVTDVPTAIGFGIHTPQQAATMAELADGVIVGSAIVHQIAAGNTRQHTDLALTEYVKQVRTAIDKVSIAQN